MMGNKAWYLVSYDVRDPDRLTRVAKRLQAYGARIQYSVFRCWLSRREAERLQWEMKRILAKEDELLVVELCDRCSRRVRGQGSRGKWSDPPEGFEIV